MEEHSYIYLAALAFLARDTNKKLVMVALLLASTLLMLALNFYYPVQPPTGASPWYLRSECAALGLVAAAAIRVFRHEFPNIEIKRLTPFLIILAVILSITCFSTYRHKYVQYTVAPLCLAFAINYLDRMPRAILTVLSSKYLRWFGTCSFSLYLWQQAFFLAVKHQQIPQLVGLFSAISIGAVSFYLIERPTRKWLNEVRWRGGWRPAKAITPDT